MYIYLNIYIGSYIYRILHRYIWSYIYKNYTDTHRDTHIHIFHKIILYNSQNLVRDTLRRYYVFKLNDSQIKRGKITKNFIKRSNRLKFLFTWIKKKESIRFINTKNTPEVQAKDGTSQVL